MKRQSTPKKSMLKWQIKSQQLKCFYNVNKDMIAKDVKNILFLKFTQWSRGIRQLNILITSPMIVDKIIPSEDYN